MTNPLKGLTFPGLPGEFQIPQAPEDIGALPAAFSGTVSDAWVSNKTYYAGDYCIHNNTLWRCLVQNTGVTPTEGTYWTAVNVANELNQDYSGTIIAGKRGGKLVYKKYVEVSLNALVASATYTSYTIPHGGANIKEILDYNFTAYNITHSNSYPMPYFTSGTVATYIESVNPTNIIIRSTAAWGANYVMSGFIYYTLN